MGDNQGDLAAGGDREDQIRHLKAQLENMLQVCTTILPEAPLNLQLQGKYTQRSPRNSYFDVIYYK